jgi:hypothetical protein
VSFDSGRELASTRVAALEIWFGRVDPSPLTGGITNQNFLVEAAIFPSMVFYAQTSWLRAARRILRV